METPGQSLLPDPVLAGSDEADPHVASASVLIDNRFKRAVDFEERMGDGVVRIFKGHPGYCSLDEPHDSHEFIYVYLDSQNHIVSGVYKCQGDVMTFAERDST